MVFPYLIDFMVYSHSSPKLSYAVKWTMNKNFEKKKSQERNKYFYMKFMKGLGKEVFGNL